MKLAMIPELCEWTPMLLLPVPNKIIASSANIVALGGLPCTFVRVTDRYDECAVGRVSCQ